MSAHDRASPTRTDLLEFFAPLPLAAVALLAINDHVLKPAFHNALTGKLSDVTLCFFLPLYLSALVGLFSRARIGVRVTVGAVTTAIVYTVLELSDRAGRVFSMAMGIVGGPFGIHGAVLTRDLTDLLALAVVPLAVVYARKRAARLAAGGVS